MTSPSEFVDRHPSLRWYVPIVITLTLLMEIAEVLR